MTTTKGMCRRSTKGLQKLHAYTVRHCKKLDFWNVVKRCYHAEITGFSCGQHS